MLSPNRRIKMEAPGASDVNASPALTIRLQDGQLQLIDPLDVLKDCAIFIIFPDSRSENLPIAISLAQSTTVYGEQKVGGRTMHWAGITSTLEDLKRGAELLRLAGSWKGTMTQINGEFVSDPFNAYLTISCYLEGRQCTSQTAHCHRVIDDPFHRNFDAFTQTVKIDPTYRPSPGDVAVVATEHVKQYAFPCKRMLMQSQFHPQFKFEQAHRTAPQDHIQAAAVEYGINICPFFDSTKFQEVGVRKVEVVLPMKTAGGPGLEMKNRPRRQGKGSLNGARDGYGRRR